VQIAEFRQYVRQPTTQAKVVEQIDAQLLAEAGFDIYRRSEKFIGATRTDKKGTEIELWVSLEKRTLGGTICAPQVINRQDLERDVDGFTQAMSDRTYTPPTANIRKHESADWLTLAQAI
jgi:hypothetical protein